MTTFAVAHMGDSPAPPPAPVELHPILGTIVLGSRSVEGATHVEEKLIVLQQRGRTGCLFSRAKSLADVVLSDGMLVTRLEVLEAGVDGHNVRPDKVAGLRRQMGESVGDVVEYRLDLTSSEASIITTRGGREEIACSEGEVSLGTLLRQSHFGGAVVRQDEEVAGYRLSDLYPTVSADKLPLMLQMKAVGRADLAGRPVIALRGTATAVVDGSLTEIQGLSLVDIESGAAIFCESNTVSTHGRDDLTRINTLQRLTLPAPN